MTEIEKTTNKPIENTDCLVENAKSTKEIEEMAKIIQTKFSCMIQGNFCDKFFQCKDCPHNKEYSESIATALHNAHYRTEAEVRAEVAKEISDKVDMYVACSWGSEEFMQGMQEGKAIVTKLAQQLKNEVQNDRD